jgi:hypothetical protein
VGQLVESTALDGLRTWADSPHEPLDLQTLIGRESGYSYDVAAAPLRRSGSMTDQQKRVRAQREKQLGLPERGARRRAAHDQFVVLDKLRKPKTTAVCCVDNEPDYPRALGDVRGQVSICHRTISSKARRDPSNPLWRINQFHLMTRHSLKSQTRETIAHHRCLRALMDRALALQTWINTVKGVTERHAAGSRITPSMKLGLERRPLRPRQIFDRRLFTDRLPLPAELVPLYEGRIKARPREHRTVIEYVFAY